MFSQHGVRMARGGAAGVQTRYALGYGRAMQQLAE